MSKQEAILKAAEGTFHAVTLASFMTGHGIIQAAAATVKYKIPTGFSRQFCVYKSKQIQEAFQKAKQEWNALNDSEKK